MGKVINVDGQDYEIPSEQAIAVTNALIYVWEKLGKPRDLFTESGRKLMSVIIATWEDTYPIEYTEWKGMRDEYQSSEKEIKEQVREGTGRNLAAVPYYVLIMMRKFFPDNQPFKRDFWMKLAREWPIFRMANRI